MKVEPGGKVYDVVEELVDDVVVFLLVELEELVLDMLEGLEEFDRLMLVVAVEV